MRVGIYRRVETFSISRSLLTRRLAIFNWKSDGAALYRAPRLGQSRRRSHGLRFQDNLAFFEHFG